MHFILPLFILTVLLTSCATSYIPKSVEKPIYFGMPLEDFKKSHPQAELAETKDWRYVYLEEVGSEDINSFVFYFDRDGEFPLYEVIINYNSVEKRDEVAEFIFGEPNHDEKEWRVTREDSFNIWAWPHEKKLVIVGMIPDTEWSEEDW